MKPFSNFPIFNEHWNYGNQAIIHYLLTFPEYHFTFSKDNPRIISSLHRYSDHLIIKLIWKLSDFSYFIVESFEDLLRFQDEEKIELQSFHFACLSSIDNIPSSNTAKKFDEMIQSYKKPFTSSQYIQLEHTLKENVKIPDLFFNELIHTINCYLAFEDYLKNNLQ